MTGENDNSRDAKRTIGYPINLSQEEYYGITTALCNILSIIYIKNKFVNQICYIKFSMTISNLMSSEQDDAILNVTVEWTDIIPKDK